MTRRNLGKAVLMVLIALLLTAALLMAACKVTPTVKEVKFGTVFPLTGFLGADGATLKNAVDLAVNDINAAGGIKSLGGAKLVVSHGDSQCKPDIGASEAERLILEGAVALFGSYQSAVTMTASHVAERARVPFIVTVSAADEIMQRDFKYIFRFNNNLSEFGRQGAAYLKAVRELTGEPLKTVVYTHEDSIFGTSTYEAFEKAAPEYGLDILAEVPYSLVGLTDVTPQISRVKALNPDVWVQTGYLRDGVMLVRTAAELGLRVKAIFSICGAMATPQFIAEIGELSNYILEDNFYPNTSDPKVREIYARYQKEYGEAPSSGLSFSAYQGVYILADAIERAKSVDPIAIRDALAETNLKDHFFPYPGPITFDETGECPSARTALLQIQNGRLLIVLPEQFAEANIIYPMPVR